MYKYSLGLYGVSILYNSVLCTGRAMQLDQPIQFTISQIKPTTTLDMLKLVLYCNQLAPSWDPPHRCSRSRITRCRNGDPVAWWASALNLDVGIIRVVFLVSVIVGISAVYLHAPACLRCPRMLPLVHSIIPSTLFALRTPHTTIIRSLVTPDDRWSMIDFEPSVRHHVLQGKLYSRWRRFNILNTY